MTTSDKSIREYVYVDCCDKDINCMEEIPVVVEWDITRTSIDAFREIIMDTVNQLESTSDFLKNEIVERNLLINTLILRNANDSC